MMFMLNLEVRLGMVKRLEQRVVYIYIISTHSFYFFGNSFLEGG